MAQGLDIPPLFILQTSNRVSIESGFPAEGAPFWVTARREDHADFQNLHFPVCRMTTVPLMGLSQKLNEAQHLARHRVFQAHVGSTVT